MSELSKRIGRIQRREVTGGMGFAPARREEPRAMLLAARASDADSAKSAIEAGADVVLLEAVKPDGVAAIIGALPRSCVGVLVDQLREADAETLHGSSSDFVVSPLAATESAAVNTEKMGQVVAVTGEITDAALRSLGPLGFDALFVQGEAAAPTLADQLELVRLASFSGLPLALNVEPGASVAHLRVLRDSGGAIAIAPAGASTEDLKQLAETLVAVPAPRRGGRGGDMALVPAASAPAHDDDETEEPE